MAQRFNEFRRLFKERHVWQLNGSHPYTLLKPCEHGRHLWWRIARRVLFAFMREMLIIGLYDERMRVLAFDLQRWTFDR